MTTRMTTRMTTTRTTRTKETARADRRKIRATVIRGAATPDPILVRVVTAGPAAAAKPIRPPIAARLSRVAIAIRAIPIPVDPF